MLDEAKLVLTLYIASGNAGKLRDFESAVSGFLIRPLPHLDTIPAPREDELTFEGNARTKALYYSTYAPRSVVLADDSGLEVDALDGAPGVRSARYADDAGYSSPPGMSLDERNNACLQSALLAVPDHLRQARYRCVLAAVRNGKILAIADGSVTGEILSLPRGTGGFGYDPLFFLPEHAQTMAELDPATRLSLSHRGQALRALLPQLTAHTSQSLP